MMISRKRSAIFTWMIGTHKCVNFAHILTPCFPLSVKKWKTLLSWWLLIWCWLEHERKSRTSCWWKSSGEVFLPDPFHRSFSCVCIPGGTVELPLGETSCEQSGISSDIESYVMHSQLWDVGDYMLCDLCHLHLLWYPLSSCVCCGCTVIHSQWRSPAVILSYSSGLHTTSIVSKAPHSGY